MQDDFRPVKGSVKPASRLKPTPSQTNILEQYTPFETPDQVAQSEAAATPLIQTTAAAIEQPKSRLHKHFSLAHAIATHRYTSALVTIIIIAIIGAGYALLAKSEAATPQAQQPTTGTNATTAAKPTTVASKLTGLPVAAAINQRPVVGVMIENSPAARPQSGLSGAGVIFEAVAEGGITRFLALYQDNQPTEIGPVRSARPYFVQWNESFRAAYAHVGGSADALSNIKKWNVQDLNQFSDSGPYRRVSSRAAPHNVYSSVADLAAVATKRGYRSDYGALARKAATPLPTPTANIINLNISSAAYNSSFTYNKAANNYLRAEGGAAQVDATTKTQLAPSTVVAMVVPVGAGSRTSQGSSYTNYNPIGSGQAYIFQDGGVTVGSWSKASNTAQISLSDQAGKAVQLNPGQTWFTALTASNKVTYR